MIRFNVIGLGILDTDPTGIGFKKDNQQWHYSEITKGRSFEFEAPMTDHNRAVLDYGDSPDDHGWRIRQRLVCQLTYDGGAAMGTLEVTSCTPSAFNCVFHFADPIPSDRPLSTIDFERFSVTWSVKTPVHEADEAASLAGSVNLILYERPENSGYPFCSYLPALDLLTMTNTVCQGLGKGLVTDIGHRYWLVFAGMNGMNGLSVAISMNSGSATSSEPTLIEAVPITLHSATAVVFGAFIGGTDTPSMGFKALQDLDVTFVSVPDGMFLVRSAETIRGYEVLNADPSTGGAVSLYGTSVKLKKGSIYFFANKHPSYAYPVYGFNGSTIPDPYDIMLTVSTSGNIADSMTWYLSNNVPDMTCFEFLRSVALATGRELTFDDDAVYIMPPAYGEDFIGLDKVVSVDEVSRCVGAWGDSTRHANVRFKCNDEVTDPYVVGYEVENNNLFEKVEHVCKFSEGEQGDNGLFIDDMTQEQDYKVKVKHPTIAYAPVGERYLQRIEPPANNAYFDIAANSTMVRLRVLAGEAAFFELEKSHTLTWRGVAYVWTEAEWADGVLSLTLQKVSQPIFG